MNKKILLASAVSAALLTSGCATNEEHSPNSEAAHPAICAIVGGGLGALVAAGADASGAMGAASVMTAAIAAGLCYDPDTDLDGVPNSKDECPDTPAGDVVDEVGCSVKVEEEVMEEVAFFVPSQCKNYVQAVDGRVVGFTPLKFAFDNYELSRGMKHHMSCVADAISQNGLNVELQGNTDSSGTERYNMWLGGKRAEAAYNYMTSVGTDASALSTKSLGESNPASSNDTSEGMADNRRVDFVMK
ncbi:OmpA family protein [Motilimonas sp. 1_MG-2023]|uniref:OmpA family protein n=1 Tax=Motilimonas TaxID=1914248 RepID=UPI0026E38094|nr:OmpA family protein [Motilimonas sp. 1_MG-2023]MDO6525726.1 OmpA family protein [Motilimonas sp. 1_MG-2023]